MFLEKNMENVMRSLKKIPHPDFRYQSTALANTITQILLAWCITHDHWVLFIDWVMDNKVKRLTKGKLAVWRWQLRSPARSFPSSSLSGWKKTKISGWTQFQIHVDIFNNWTSNSKYTNRIHLQFLSHSDAAIIWMMLDTWLIDVFSLIRSLTTKL